MAAHAEKAAQTLGQEDKEHLTNALTGGPSGGRTGGRIGAAVGAAEAVVGAILAHFLPEADDLGQPVILHNAAGIAVGDVRPGRAVQTVLDGITL